MGWIFDVEDCGRPSVNTPLPVVVVNVTSGIMVTPEVVEASELCDEVEDELPEPNVVDTGTGLGDDVELILVVLKLKLVGELVVVLVVES